MEDSEESLVSKAKDFATRAHKNHFRSNAAREPYIVHPAEVATLVESAGASEDEIAAAWLHDTVEDTHVTLDDVRNEFGPAVARIVDGLTDPPEFEALPLAERKAAQAQRIKTEPQEVRRVKIADQTSNVKVMAIDPPVQWDREKIVAYVRGARAIVASCRGTDKYLEHQFDLAYERARNAYPELA